MSGALPIRIRDLDLPKPLLSSRQMRLGAWPEKAPALWGFDELAGRLAELSSLGPSATLTLAFRVLLDAQSKGESVAWISARSSTFYPPDAAESGVDLQALVVVRARGAHGAIRAADHLLRSGGFGLVVLDLGPEARVPMAAQSRLLGLAQNHGAAMLCLTEKGAHAASLGSLVSLRAETRRERIGEDRFRCQVQVLKDKRRAPGWSDLEICRGPAGLR